MQETSSWQYDPAVNPADYEGFVYLITNLETGRMYVGQKSMWHYSKGKPRRESKWRAYWGSCKPLLDDVEALGEAKFKREVLHWCATKGELTQLEVAEQFKRDVLTAKMEDGQPLFYNRNIMRRFFAKDGCHSKPHTEVAKAKMRQSHVRNPRKLVHTDEAKAAIGRANKGRKRTDEQRAAHSAKMKGRKMPPRSDQAKEASAAGLTARWADSDYKARTSASIKEAYAQKHDEIMAKRGDVVGREEAAQIKALLDGGLSMAEVARRIGCSVNPVTKIRDGRHWTQRD